MIDYEKFYNHVRKGIMGPELDQGEVDGAKTIIESFLGLPASYIAYALATAWHETAHTMMPISEYGGDKYFFRMYDKDGDRPHVARRLGNTVAGDGVKYAGRGYVQITGRRNYALAARKLDEPLIDQPQLALARPIAARILKQGMLHGWFTGKSLEDYLPAEGYTLKSFIQARRIVNGTDRDEDIAMYAVSFYKALEYAGYDGKCSATF